MRQNRQKADLKTGVEDGRKRKGTRVLSGPPPPAETVAPTAIFALSEGGKRQGGDASRKKSEVQNTCPRGPETSHPAKSRSRRR